VSRLVLWSREALDDFKEQIAFIAKNNLVAAQSVADRIKESGKALGHRPTGRVGRVSGTFEKTLAPLPYTLVHELRAIDGRDRVVIVRVIHTSRDRPAKG
jgi:toxin ParE1/3/4